MTGDTDSILRMLRDIARVTARAAQDDAAADALWRYAEDCRCWGLASDEAAARRRSRALRIGALLARGQAAAMRAKLADPDGSLLG